MIIELVATFVTLALTISEMLANPKKILKQRQAETKPDQENSDRDIDEEPDDSLIYDDLFDD